MRPPYDDSDGFDFADSVAVRRIFQEQQREESRLAKRRHGRGHGHKHPYDSLESDDYEDYDENEFDSYSSVPVDH